MKRNLQLELMTRAMILEGLLGKYKEHLNQLVYEENVQELKNNAKTLDEKLALSKKLNQLKKVHENKQAVVSRNNKEVTNSYIAVNGEMPDNIVEFMENNEDYISDLIELCLAYPVKEGKIFLGGVSNKGVFFADGEKYEMFHCISGIAKKLC